MSEFFGRKIPNAILPFSCSFNHNSLGAKYLRPRGFRLCEPFDSYQVKMKESELKIRSHRPTVH